MSTIPYIDWETRQKIGHSEIPHHSTCTLCSCSWSWSLWSLWSHTMLKREKSGAVRLKMDAGNQQCQCSFAKWSRWSRSYQSAHKWGSWGMSFRGTFCTWIVLESTIFDEETETVSFSHLFQRQGPLRIFDWLLMSIDNSLSLPSLPSHGGKSSLPW